MRPIKIKSVVLLLCAGAGVFAADLQRKAIRREMIEMDIAVRNLNSIIAMGEHKALDDSLARLSSWQIKDHPELGAAFRQVLATWQAKRLLPFASTLQKEAQELRNFAAARPTRLSDKDWSYIAAGVNRILQQCRSCHEAASKEQK